MRVFIQGASRGIGLGLAQLYGDGGEVWGIGGSAAREIPASGMQYTQMDATRFDAAAIPSLPSSGLNRIILCAAVAGSPVDPLAISPARLAEQFEINVIAQLSVLKALRPLLATDGSAKIGFIISRAGIFAPIKAPGLIGYRITKSAQIMLALSMVETFKAQGVGVYLINPGWVQTRIGGRNAPMTAAESAALLYKVIEDAGLEQTGLCLNFDGKPIKLWN